MRALPELEHRELRAEANLRYGTALTEGLLMASRDGVRFKRWNEAFLRPGIERQDTWNYSHQFTAWHVVETKSDLKGGARTNCLCTRRRVAGPGPAVRCGVTRFASTASSR